MDLDIGDDDAMKASLAKVELGRSCAYCAAWISWKPDTAQAHSQRVKLPRVQQKRLPSLNQHISGP